jgi:putative transposase
MPRIVRGVVDGFVYHVLNRGNGGQVVFHKERDYEAFIEPMKESKTRYPVKIFAYCLMPNHFHMVVMPCRASDLSKWMQWLMTSHVRRYHCHYGTSGHVWQGRYKSFPIQTDSHLITALRYVESNPLRAGLVHSSKEWLWSSCLESLGVRPTALVDEAPVELPRDWVKYLDEPMSGRELEKLRQSVNRQSPYGDSAWQIHVSKEFGLESTVRPRGRPKSVKAQR